MIRLSTARYSSSSSSSSRSLSSSAATSAAAAAAKSRWSTKQQYLSYSYPAGAASLSSSISSSLSTSPSSNFSSSTSPFSTCEPSGSTILSSSSTFHRSIAGTNPSSARPLHHQQVPRRAVHSSAAAALSTSLKSLQQQPLRTMATIASSSVEPRANGHPVETQTGPGTNGINGSAGSASPYFTNEPSGPSVHTSIPGPKAKAAIAELDKIFDTRAASLMVDYTKSIGNYVADADGNMLLDVYAQIASLPVGYNNGNLHKAASSPAMISATINRPALGNFPQHDYAEILKTGIMSVAPKGMNSVFTALAGSDANELAYKAAFMYKRRMERGGPDADFSTADMESCMVNQLPGSPNYSIMSFKAGFHGRLMASLSTTRSKPIHKLDVPAFDWPACPFPALKYPLEQHVEENKKEEQRCLEEAERLITTWHNPVAAIIIEPVQSEGGDNHASAEFFKGLRAITKKHNVLMIVDEVQTGMGATGKFWAHDHWNMQDPPDMVTFSKKAQTAGYYFGNPDLRPNKPYRQFNTWMGDPAKALLFKAIVEEIHRLDLVENTRVTGDYLYAKLEALQKKYPHEILNLRGKGQGTFIAWDSPRRDEIVAKSKAAGVNMGSCGEAAVRLRPMLIFQKHHADIFVSAMEKMISS